MQHHRDQKLQPYTGSLARMAERVDFGKVAVAVDAACPRADRSQGGRPPYPTETMVRMLFLQALYHLSDADTEHQLLDRRSFQRFCGLADELRIPDARTLWLFKQRLAQGGPGPGLSSMPCSNSSRPTATSRAAGKSSTPPPRVQEELPWRQAAYHNVDVRWKLIRRWAVTPAHVDDGKALAKVVDRSNTAARL